MKTILFSLWIMATSIIVGLSGFSLVADALIISQELKDLGQLTFTGRITPLILVLISTFTMIYGILYAGLRLGKKREAV